MEMVGQLCVEINRRPYACCERRGQVFLGSVDFN